MKIRQKVPIAGATIIAAVGAWQVGAAPGGSAKPVRSADRLLSSFKKVNKGQVDAREDQDRGFGARRLFLAIYPDATYWIHVLAVDGSVASVDISYSSSASDESWSRVVAALRSVKLPVAPAQPVGYYVFRDKALLSRLSTRASERLGPQTSVKVPANLRAPYEALMSPLSRLTFGSACGVAGTKPAGRVGAEALQKAGRVDLLGNILRGPSPEGRVYAAQAMESLAARGRALSDADREAIAKVKALPTLINACSGCMPENLSAAQLLSGKPVVQRASGS